MQRAVCLFLIVWFWMAPGFAGDVYKWVDKNGKVHFADRAPAGVKSSELTKPKSEQEPAAGSEPLKQVDPEVQKAMEGMANGLLKVKPVEGNFECDKSVFNARDGIDTMLQVGRRNVETGYVSSAEFEKKRPKLEQVMNSFSLEDCKAATGAKLEFYRCMSSDYNHVMGCGKTFSYEVL